MFCPRQSWVDIYSQHLKSWTRSTAPESVWSKVALCCWPQGPITSSLVLLVLIRISFSRVQFMSVQRKLSICEGDVAEVSISVMVVSSTYLCVRHPGAKSSIWTKKARCVYGNAEAWMRGSGKRKSGKRGTITQGWKSGSGNLSTKHQDWKTREWKSREKENYGKRTFQQFIAECTKQFPRKYESWYQVSVRHKMIADFEEASAAVVRHSVHIDVLHTTIGLLYTSTHYTQ